MTRGLLVVEDNASLRATLCTALRAMTGEEVVGAEGTAACAEVLRVFTPSLVVLDVELQDGDAFDVFEQILELPVIPRVVVVSGVAGPEQAFRLAQLGVSRFVQKPLDLAALEEAVLRAEPPNIAAHVRNAVGQVPLQDLEELVRTTMLREALARSEGNRRGAARILRISRQLLQHMLRKLPDVM
ncbi:MAG TPA: response regulator [Polyangiales bacterium]|nr:response regulator [Polyangiales bacterium]